MRGVLRWGGDAWCGVQGGRFFRGLLLSMRRPPLRIPLLCHSLRDRAGPSARAARATRAARVTRAAPAARGLTALRARAALPATWSGGAREAPLSPQRKGVK